MAVPTLGNRRVASRRAPAPHATAIARVIEAMRAADDSPLLPDAIGVTPILVTAMTVARGDRGVNRARGKENSDFAVGAHPGRARAESHGVPRDPRRVHQPRWPTLKGFPNPPAATRW